MIIYCPTGGCRKLHVQCIYACDTELKIRCEVYTKNYERFQVEPLADKYKERYGEPEFPVPYSITSKEARRVKQEKDAEKRQRQEEKKQMQQEILQRRNVKKQEVKNKLELKLKIANEKKIAKELKLLNKRTRKPKSNLITTTDVFIESTEIEMIKEKRKRRTKLEMEESRKMTITNTTNFFL